MKTTPSAKTTSRKAPGPARAQKSGAAKSGAAKSVAAKPAKTATKARTTTRARKPKAGFKDRLLELKEKAAGWVPAHPGLAAGVAAGVGAVTGALINRKR